MHIKNLIRQIHDSDGVSEVVVRASWIRVLNDAPSACHLAKVKETMNTFAQGLHGDCNWRVFFTPTPSSSWLIFCIQRQSGILWKNKVDFIGTTDWYIPMHNINPLGWKLNVSSNYSTKTWSIIQWSVFFSIFITLN